MEDKILKAIKEPLASIGVSVYSISFEKEDGVDTLFIKIDSDKVVDTDICVKASEIINPIIDDLNLEELGEYVLDICSKGSNEDGQ
jgi:ribosome maturation factor RimP